MLDRTTRKQEDRRFSAEKAGQNNRAKQTAPENTGSELQRMADQSERSNAQQAMQEMSDRSTRATVIQPRLRVGASDDKYEKEADSVADKVISQLKNERGNATSVSEIPVESAVPQSIQPKKTSGNEGGMVSPSIESAIQRARGGGQKMNPELEQDMSKAMNADFSRVRIHTDGRSDQLNKDLGAQAFTTGHDIFFGQGKYNPSDDSGQRLLGHELAHVVQQKGSSIQRSEEDSSSSDGVDFDVDTSGFGEGAEKTPLGGSRPDLFDEAETTPSEQIGEGSVTTTEKGSKKFAGAGTAVRKLVESDEKTIKEALQALARAGAFGEAIAKRELETSSGTKASAAGKASGFAGAEGEAIGIKIVDAIEGLTIMARVTGKAGVGFDLEGLMEVSREVGGIELAAKMEAKMSGFAGVLAEAKGKININAFGIAAEGKVYAFAGAKSEGEATMELQAGQLGFNGKAEYEAMAGAEAGAEGKVSIGLEGISASGKAEAFAGAKVKAGAETSLTYHGKILIKISGELEASAGVGGTIEGEFTVKNGKLVISGQLAATLGLGAGAMGSVEIDFNAIAEAIGEKLKTQITSIALDNRSVADQDRKSAADITPDEQKAIEKQLYQAVYPYLAAYGKKKEKLFKSTNIFGQKKASNLVKRENVQEIIDNKIRKKTDLSEKLRYKFSDATLTGACMDAFGNQMQPGGLIIQVGVIRAFGVKKSL